MPTLPVQHIKAAVFILRVYDARYKPRFFNIPTGRVTFTRYVTSKVRSLVKHCEHILKKFFSPSSTSADVMCNFLFQFSNWETGELETAVV